MKLLILIFFTFAASLSFASFKKGNGGNAIYCSQQDKWEILDHYEIQPILRLTPNPNITDDNFDEKILERLSLVDANLTQAFQEQQALFNKQVRWISRAHIGPVNDSYHSILPKDCSLHQAALQTDNLYLMQQEIWQSLSPFQQKVLKLHELLYRSLLRIHDLEDSRPVRALVGLLLSEQLTTMTTQDRIQFFDKYGIIFR